MFRCGDPYQATLALITGEARPLDLFSIFTAQAPRALYDAHFFCWVSVHGRMWGDGVVNACECIRPDVVWSLGQANFAQHDYLTEHTLRFLGPDTKKIVAPPVVVIGNKSWAGRAELEVDTNAFATHRDTILTSRHWFRMIRARSMKSQISDPNPQQDALPVANSCSHCHSHDCASRHCAFDVDKRTLPPGGRDDGGRATCRPLLRPLAAATASQWHERAERKFSHLWSVCLPA